MSATTDLLDFQSPGLQVAKPLLVGVALGSPRRSFGVESTFQLRAARRQVVNACRVAYDRVRIAYRSKNLKTPTTKSIAFNAVDAQHAAICETNPAVPEAQAQTDLQRNPFADGPDCNLHRLALVSVQQRLQMVARTPCVESYSPVGFQNAIPHLSARCGRVPARLENNLRCQT
jgi:hypothetical protein